MVKWIDHTHCLKILKLRSARDASATHGDFCYHGSRKCSLGQMATYKDGNNTTDNSGK